MTIINELQLLIYAKFHSKLEAVHKRRRQLEGVKNWSKLPMDSIKKTADRGRGCQKSGKIADVVYGWSSAYNDFFLLLLVGMPRACSRLACVCM